MLFWYSLVHVRTFDRDTVLDKIFNHQNLPAEVCRAQTETDFHGCYLGCVSQSEWGPEKIHVQICYSSQQNK